MKKLLLTSVLLMAACQPTSTPEKQAVYRSENFTLYPDRVEQGAFTGKALSPTNLVSDYRSMAAQTYSRLIPFKFAINEKDVELPPGHDHWVLIGEERESPVIVFGQTPEPMPEAASAGYLPTNYAYTFRVDMSPVLEQFEEKGYYEGYDGTKIAKSDFKGFQIAGASEPLSWDFVNLEEKNLTLQPTEDPNIYAIPLTLNPYDETANAERHWELSADLSDRPKYESDQPLIDALYNLSLEEAIVAVEPDSTFRTGAKWAGVWTRDISYSIVLALAQHEPEVAKISLRKKVKNGRIIQDTGSGGAWPVSSDRTTWVLAAWEIYKATGDRAWLDEVYPIVKNTLADDRKTLPDAGTGLYKGESSFLDWREQTYPKWMSNMDIHVSQNLGTNVVHYQAHRILAEMAKIKGEPHEEYETRAQTIKTGLNEYLWMPEQGYYAQYRYGRPYLSKSPRFEALGEALAILYGVTDYEQEARAAAILANAPLTEYGATCIYPQIPGIPPYHNNGVWPFVQAYWNLAAARGGNEAVLEHGLASLYRAAGLFLTNYENFVAQTGDFDGTEINSERQLWSIAGNLAMVHRVFMGVDFEPDGLRFSPAVPESFGGRKRLSNFRYRNATLDIVVTGFGNSIATFKLDGKEQAQAFLPADLSGAHTVEITLDNANFNPEAINLVPNRFSLPTPKAEKEAPFKLSWEAVEGAEQYRLYCNRVWKKVPSGQTVSDIPEGNGLVVAQVSAVDAQGYESFASEPVYFSEPVSVVEIETVASASDKPYVNFSGEGFVEVSLEQNRRFALSVNVERAGRYLIDLRYSNGSGPWNTDNKCAIRSLSANGEYAGALVFPQRGEGEWSDWGYSNGVEVTLKAGANRLQITFEDWNANMNGEVNTAMLDQLRVFGPL